ncbi:hypothetical protein PENTCL1PPCAC_30715 [Pristionchus entomophagus]|uniref:CSD domain-containing protein n=1 Tax=Pristionchus entomophagus TaxID=358040 RepID=A0AAV5TAL9_9BILA|nr:hypothetical protein PENTCL1PPCAC_14443 [Pristionchus entomophagus]GMT08541.1 hypothetical protein PENTCL1PPCAC_30715 [Pristionchus entomophagus]
MTIAPPTISKTMNSTRFYLLLLLTVMATNGETGEVKFFNTQMGYGYIDRRGKPDVFVDFNAILNEGDESTQAFRKLKSGQKVEFDVVKEHGIYRAANVQVIP